MGLLEIIATTPTPVAILLSGGVAAFIAVTGIRKQRQIAREKNSLEFEEAYKKNSTIRAAWDSYRNIINNSTEIPVLEWSKPKSFSTKESKNIRILLNEWERVANAIEHNLYDEVYLYKMYGSTVINMHTRLLPYIRARQEINYRVYLQLDKLVIGWRVRRSVENRNKSTVKELKKIQQLYSKI